MTLKMTLPEDLAMQMDQIAEEVPTSMGIDMAVSIVTLGPSVTVATTSLFTYEVFRGILNHWFKHTKGPVSITLKDGRSKVSFELDRLKANELATGISEVVTKFIQAQPDKATSSTQGSP